MLLVEGRGGLFPTAPLVAEQLWFAGSMFCGVVFCTSIFREMVGVVEVSGTSATVEVGEVVILTSENPL